MKIKELIFISLIIFLLIPTSLCAQEHGSSITQNGTTVYEDGTVSVRSGDNTVYDNGRIDTKLPDVKATIIHIPEDQKREYGGYGTSVHINNDGED